jgi:hypothetical protein
MLLLGGLKYYELLVTVRWMVGDKIDQTACLYHPNHNQEQQQQQLARVKAALFDWLAEAGEGSNPTLLAWVALLVGQLHPVPEERLPAAEAAARLEQLMPALANVSGALTHGSA